MKFLLIPIFVLTTFFTSFSQLPAYYTTISTTDSGQVLKQQLADLITATHTTFLSYTPGIWNLLEVADRDPDDTTKVLLIYGYNDTDAGTVNDRTRLISLRQTGSSNVGVWNREHTFPKSLGTPDLGTSGAGSDGHHLRAADGQMNSTRNNRSFTYGSGNAKTVGSGSFYPGDEWKGDVARMMMYLYLRYPSQCIPVNVGVPTITASTFDQMTDIFLIWHEQDPVSEFEQQRNNIIYDIQGNRNPFIDEPIYATRIWGPTPQDPLSLSNPELIQTIHVFPNPARGLIYVSLSSEKDWDYLITDQLGRIIQTGEQTNEIIFENQVSGTYFLTILFEDGVINSKFMTE